MVYCKVEPGTNFSLNAIPTIFIMKMRLKLPYVCKMVAILFCDDAIKWKHFPRYWPFVRGIHRSPVNSPDKGQWRGALMFSLIFAWINGWVKTREAGELSRHRAHYDVTVMCNDVFMDHCLSRGWLQAPAMTLNRTAAPRATGHSWQMRFVLHLSW